MSRRTPFDAETRRAHRLMKEQSATHSEALTKYRDGAVVFMDVEVEDR